MASVPTAGRTHGVPGALRGGDGLVVVIDVSSSTLGFSHLIAKSLLALADDPSQRAGLVLASQTAYVALPPETPSSALRGWQRMIDYINEKGGVLGKYKLVQVDGDGQSKAEVAINEAERLLNVEKVDILAGV